MHKKKDILLIVAYILFLVFPHHTGAEDNLSPVTNSGKKWRIGYFESQNFYEYTEGLKELFEALISIGWIDKVNIPEVDASKKNAARKFWSWMSKNTKSNYLEFVDNAFWSNEDEKKSCEANRENIYEKVVIGKNVDLMIAMGTVAGKCLSESIKEYSVNTMVMCARNPVESKIVNNYDRSGIDHFHAAVEKDLILNEINLFYRLVNFKKLGIVYQDNDNDSVYSAIDDVRSFKDAHKFELIEEVIPKEFKSEQRVKALPEIYKKLSEKVDAVYITEHRKDSQENRVFLKELLLPMFQHKVATWSQTPRSWMVKYGVLMSLDGADPADIGMFEAKVMAQILRGKKPGEINQLFDNPKNESITLNLETAQKIQLDLRWEALAIAEKIYENICENIEDDACE